MSVLWPHKTDYLVSFQASPLTVQEAVSGDTVLIDGWRWVLGRDWMAEVKEPDNCRLPLPAGQTSSGWE